MAGAGDLKKSQKSSRAWDSLKPSLSSWILDAVDRMGLKRMTPVQASTIPLAMGNKDVVVEAVTGSGKTLAFLIPVVEKLLRLDEPLKKHHVGAIIISPTRELAAQIYGVLADLLMFHDPSRPYVQTEKPSDDVDEEENAEAFPSQNETSLKVIPQLLVGGDTTPTEDLKQFLKNSPNLLIATPGRLLEILKSPHVRCPQSAFEILILDEADRLLDLGFKEDLQSIIGKLPKQRRTGLFSASISEAVDQIVRVGLRNPVKIAVKVKGASGKDDQRTPASLSMTYAVSKPSHKLPAMAKLLTKLNPVPTKTIVFLSTCAAVDYMQHLLPTILNGPNGSSFTVIPLHGKHPANVRQKNFTRFSNAFNPSILLTTDVAARGLDIPQVDLVIQIDPPSDPKVFMHRCGRAGRAGRAGLSVIFLTPGHEEDYVPYLEIRKTPITRLQSPSIEINEDDAEEATKKMRSVVLHDRALHDKAQRAFVSWVHAYSKHQASSIFRISDQDWADLGRAWALLKLPKMPEAKKWDGDRSLGVDVNWNNFSYKDKQRESARLQEQNLKDTNGSNVTTTDQKVKKKNAWSEQYEMKEEKEKRREKRRAKRDREKTENMTPEEKMKQEELDRLIEEVKRRKVAQDELGEFEGFDD